MKANKKSVLLFLTFLMVMAMSIGCSKSSENTSVANTETNTETSTGTSIETTENATENSVSDSGNSANENSDILGQVTAVNGNTITLSVLSEGGGNGGGKAPEMQSGDKPEGQSGEQPSMQGGDKPEGQSGEQPSMQGGDKPEGQSGEQPEMQSGDKPDMQSVETEEKEITISDESIISVTDGDTTKTGTLSDITVGSMLQVSYTTDASGNEVLSSVVVRNLTQSSNE